MLLRFGVGNHRSIKAYQELLFTATTLKDREEGLLEVFTEPTPTDASSTSKSLRLVPVVAIYGANAAGKSTLINAFEFFISLIRSSHESTSSREGTPYAPFLLDNESRSLPSRYDADFIINDTRYHYGFTLDGKRVTSEWLYSFALAAKRQTRVVLYHRDADIEPEFNFGKSLKGENKQISRLTRQNSLFLSAAAQNAHPHLSEIYEFIQKQITSRVDTKKGVERLSEQLMTYFTAESNSNSEAMRFLKAADIGISGIDFKRTALEEKDALFISDMEALLSRHLDIKKEEIEISKEKITTELLHMGSNEQTYPIKLRQESAGTLALLQMLGPIFHKLKHGGLVIIDELNSTLHPLISQELIRLFSFKTTNPGRAQLIFSTHDTNLLSGGLLRRDQIWFAEKDRAGATHIYPMSDIQVRANDNLERGYLTGRFGAIPFIGAGYTNLIPQGT